MQIGVIYYYVRDMKKALAFYKDKLGLKLKTFWQNLPNPWAELEAGDVLLGLEEVRNRGESVRPPWGGAVVSFQVENIEEAKSDLEKKGVNFTTEILIFEKVKVVQFEDPDGNRLELHERL